MEIMKLIYCGICDIGLKREKNQDSVFMCSKEEMSLFVVADGMGGYANGEKASQAITDELKSWAEKFAPDMFDHNFSKMMISLRNKIEEINNRIYQELNLKQICGSTCILLFIYKDCYGIINVGDSRIYKKEGWKIRSVMKDDVWENRIDVKERFSNKEIMDHENYGKLLQAVGISETISIASKTDLLKKGDSFLLCSDGLYKFCPEKDMRKIVHGMNENNMEESLKKMVAKCYEAGAKDNISVILVKCV